MATDHADDRISVVIPTYNRRASLERVVEPLRADPATFEIVVVVDGSDDGSMEMLLEWSRGDSRLRPIFQENAGSNAARERGVREATGTVVLMLDDDVEAGDGLVAGHLRHHLGRSGLVVVGYMPVSRASLYGADATTASIYSDSYEETCLSYEAAPETVFRRFWSGNVSMRRDDVLRVGLTAEFDIRYHVDLEFGLRCERAGLVGVFDRSLPATHHYSRTLDQFARESRRGGQEYAKILDAAQHPDPESLHPLHSLSRAGRIFSVAGSSRPMRYGSKLLLRLMIRLSTRLHARTIERRFVRALILLEVYDGFRTSRGPRLRELRRSPRVSNP